jgi:hypothetical protein
VLTKYFDELPDETTVRFKGTSPSDARISLYANKGCITDEWWAERAKADGQPLLADGMGDYTNMCFFPTGTALENRYASTKERRRRKLDEKDKKSDEEKDSSENWFPDPSTLDGDEEVVLTDLDFLRINRTGADQMDTDAFLEEKTTTRMLFDPTVQGASGIYHATGSYCHESSESFGYFEKPVVWDPFHHLATLAGTKVGERRNTKYVPCLSLPLQLPINQLVLRFYWRDQGWGNRKGEIRVELLRLTSKKTPVHGNQLQKALTTSSNSSMGNGAFSPPPRKSSANGEDECISIAMGGGDSFAADRCGATAESGVGETAAKELSRRVHAEGVFDALINLSGSADAGKSKMERAMFEKTEYLKHWKWYRVDKAFEKARELEQKSLPTHVPGVGAPIVVRSSELEIPGPTWEFTPKDENDKGVRREWKDAKESDEPDVQVVSSVTLGTAPHEETFAEIHFVEEDDIVKLARPGDVFRFGAKVGGGGGHSLFMKDFFVGVDYNRSGGDLEGSGLWGGA